LTTFLLTLIFHSALFSGTKHRRDLPFGSTESTNYANFSRPLGSILPCLIIEISPNMSNFQAVLHTGGQLKVSSPSPLSLADHLMEMGEYLKKVAPRTVDNL